MACLLAAVPTAPHLPNPTSSAALLFTPWLPLSLPATCAPACSFTYPWPRPICSYLTASFLPLSPRLQPSSKSDLRTRLLTQGLDMSRPSSRPESPTTAHDSPPRSPVQDIAAGHAASGKEALLADLKGPVERLAQEDLWPTLMPKQGQEPQTGAGTDGPIAGGSTAQFELVAVANTPAAAGVAGPAVAAVVEASPVAKRASPQAAAEEDAEVAGILMAGATAGASGAVAIGKQPQTKAVAHAESSSRPASGSSIWQQHHGSRVADSDCASSFGPEHHLLPHAPVSEAQGGSLMWRNRRRSQSRLGISQPAATPLAAGPSTPHQDPAHGQAGDEAFMWPPSPTKQPYLQPQPPPNSLSAPPSHHTMHASMSTAAAAAVSALSSPAAAAAGWQRQSSEAGSDSTRWSEKEREKERAPSEATDAPTYYKYMKQRRLSHSGGAVNRPASARPASPTKALSSAPGWASHSPSRPVTAGGRARAASVGPGRRSSFSSMGMPMQQAVHGQGGQKLALQLASPLMIEDPTSHLDVDETGLPLPAGTQRTSNPAAQRASSLPLAVAQAIEELQAMVDSDSPALALLGLDVLAAGGERIPGGSISTGQVYQGREAPGAQRRAGSPTKAASSPQIPQYPEAPSPKWPLGRGLGGAGRPRSSKASGATPHWVVEAVSAAKHGKARDKWDEGERQLRQIQLDGHPSIHTGVTDLVGAQTTCSHATSLSTLISQPCLLHQRAGGPYALTHVFFPHFPWAPYHAMLLCTSRM